MNETLIDDVLPMEHLEARICELAGHLTAATCRFLELVADFDARQGWASWEMPSCAAWLSWKCQLAPGTARAHRRVTGSPRPPSSRPTPADDSTSTWPSGSPSPTPRSAPTGANRQLRPH